MSRLTGIVGVALLVIAGPTIAKFRGPISGVIETSDVGIAVSAALMQMADVESPILSCSHPQDSIDR